MTLLCYALSAINAAAALFMAYEGETFLSAVLFGIALAWGAIANGLGEEDR